MNQDRIDAYARAFYAIAQAEGGIGEVEDELFRFARTLEGHDELRSTLADPHIEASRRQQIVEDLLGGKAAPLTVALVSFAVGAGRIAELPAVIDRLVAMSASESKRSVAEVRSAVPLSDDQRARLAAALKASTGLDVEVKVIIDPSVMGGLVTQIGDTVIDGSVRHRLAQLRNIG